PPAGKSAAPKAAPKAAPNQRTADTKAAPGARGADLANQVVATVNGENITRGELVEFMNQYQFSANNEQQIYDGATNALVNTKLLTQFLNKQKVVVPEKEINDTIAAIEKDLGANNQTLAAKMAETGTSLSDLRKKIADRLKWKTYVLSKASEP